MRLKRYICSAVVGLAALGASGCNFITKGQLAACQSQNRILAEQNKAQLAEIANLKVHARSVEDQLIHAERLAAQRSSAPEMSARPTERR